MADDRPSDLDNMRQQVRFHMDRAELLKTMRRHPAGSGLTTGAVNMTGHRTIPRDLPHNNEETAR